MFHWLPFQALRKADRGTNVPLKVVHASTKVANLELTNCNDTVRRIDHRCEQKTSQSLVQLPHCLLGNCSKTRAAHYC